MAPHIILKSNSDIAEYCIRFLFVLHLLRLHLLRRFRRRELLLVIYQERRLWFIFFSVFVSGAATCDKGSNRQSR